MLQYTFIENPLNPSDGEYIAQPVNVRSYDFQEIVQRINARYPGLTPTQIYSAVSEFFEELGVITEDGEAFNTPFVISSWSIPGVEKGAADSIDPKKHPAKIHLIPGSRLREAAKKVKMEKVIVAETIPHVLEVKDVNSGTINAKLTPGGVIELRGTRLRFLPTEANNGIFLINEEKAEAKLPIIVENKPSKLIAVLPTPLQQGEYFIEVRTSYSHSGKPMKNLKQGRFHKALKVE